MTTEKPKVTSPDTDSAGNYRLPTTCVYCVEKRKRKFNLSTLHLALSAYSAEETHSDLKDRPKSDFFGNGCTVTRLHNIKNLERHPEKLRNRDYEEQQGRFISSLVFDTADIARATRELSDLSAHYNTHYIPKKSGGKRRIDAPDEALDTAQRSLLSFLQQHAPDLHHTAAYAYVKGRSPLKALQKHQKANSTYFLKIDLKDFFGSITEDWLHKVLACTFPFYKLFKNSKDNRLTRHLKLAFLNGALPQGSCLSPYLSNLAFLPIDHAFSRFCHKHKLTYTRYADDLLISGKHPAEVASALQELEKILRDMQAPFRIHYGKVRLGSLNGKNWNLGLMLNKDNQITVGHQAKKRLKAMLHQFALAKEVTQEEALQLLGLIAYHRQIDRDYTDYLIARLSQKLAVDIDKKLINAANGAL